MPRHITKLLFSVPKTLLKLNSQIFGLLSANGNFHSVRRTYQSISLNRNYSVSRPIRQGLTEEDLKPLLITDNNNQALEVDSISSAIDILGRIKSGEGKIWTGNERYHLAAPPLKFPFGIWFRGQECWSWDLMPSIFRNDKLHVDETSLVRHFELQNPREGHDHSSVFEWLSLMQHYGAPTRLLDWSESLLVALYFAVSNPQYDELDALLWILNAERLNKLSNLRENQEIGVAMPSYLNVKIRAEMAVLNDIEELSKRKVLINSEEPDAFPHDSLRATIEHPDSEKATILRKKLSMPTAVYPKKLTDRLKAQSGVFTLHGGKSYYDDYIDAEQYPVTKEHVIKDKNQKMDRECLTANLTLQKPVERQLAGPCRFFAPRSLVDLNGEASEPILKAVRINKQGKRKIRTQLFELSIHEGTMFVGLDHQSSAIKKLWTTEKFKR